MSSSPSSLRSYGLPALTLAVLIPACLLMLASFPLTFPFTEHQAGQFTRTLSTTGPVALRVQTGSGSISVHAGNGSSVTIQATIYARHPHSDANLIHQVEQNPPIHQVGSQIQIGPLPREWSRQISISYVVSTPASSSADLSSGSGDVDVSGLQGAVNATTGSGSVRASELGQLLNARTGSGDITASSVAGDTHLETGSGSIRATGLGGSARLSTGSGDVVISGCQQGLRASTGSGSIRATGLRSDFHASTGSGDVDAQGVLPDNHAWDLGTGSGSVHIDLPSSTHAQVDLRTDSGSIHTVIPVQVTGKLSPHHMVGTIGGANASASLSAHTGSGDIQIR